MFNIDKEINLIPLKNGTGYNRALIFTSVFAGIMVMTALILFAYILLQMKINRLKAENARITAEINSIGDVDEAYKNYEKKQSELQQMKGTLSAIQNEKVDVLAFLKNLSRYIPENVYVSSLSLSDGNSFNVSFIVTNPIDIIKLVIKLRQMDVFENVEISSVPITNGENAVSFSLKIKGKTPPSQ